MILAFGIVVAVVLVVLAVEPAHAASTTTQPSGGGAPADSKPSTHSTQVTPVASPQDYSESATQGDASFWTPNPMPSVPASTTPTGMEADPINPYDEESWPSNDLIDNVVHGIALAEGYGASRRGGTDSAGTSRHNPGDLSDNGNAVTGGVTYPQSLHSGSQIVDYGNHTNGWNICRIKISRIVNGQSSIANAAYTWLQLAQVWVGRMYTNEPDASLFQRQAGWATAVVNYLDVPASDSIGDYFGV